MQIIVGNVNEAKEKKKKNLSYHYSNNKSRNDSNYITGRNSKDIIIYNITPNKDTSPSRGG